MLGVRLIQLALLAASGACLLGGFQRRLGRWALAGLAVAVGLVSGTAVGVDVLARLMHLPVEEMRYDAVLLFACGASVAALMGAGASWLARHPLYEATPASSALASLAVAGVQLGAAASVGLLARPLARGVLGMPIATAADGAAPAQPGGMLLAAAAPLALLLMVAASLVKGPILRECVAKALADRNPPPLPLYRALGTAGGLAGLAALAGVLTAPI